MWDGLLFKPFTWRVYVILDSRLFWNITSPYLYFGDSLFQFNHSQLIHSLVFHFCTHIIAMMDEMDVKVRHDQLMLFDIEVFTFQCC